MPNCQLVIDSRERVDSALLVTEIKKRHQFEAGQLGLAQLPLGDAIVLQDSDGPEPVLRACWERKTYRDFLASQSDGRWLQQPCKLIEERQKSPGTVFGLIIEGSLDETNVGAHNRTHVRNMLWDYSKRDILVVYTGGVEETCDYLTYMRHSFSKEESMADAQKEAMLKLRVYSGKKSAITPENYYLECLKMIPGVTGRHALAITAKYPQRTDLEATLRRDKKALTGIKIDEKRAIGKDLSMKIQTFLL